MLIYLMLMENVIQFSQGNYNCILQGVTPNADTLAFLKCAQDVFIHIKDC